MTANETTTDTADDPDLPPVQQSDGNRLGAEAERLNACSIARP
jgi:hypothetical protein